MGQVLERARCLVLVSAAVGIGCALDSSGLGTAGDAASGADSAGSSGATAGSSSTSGAGGTAGGTSDATSTASTGSSASSTNAAEGGTVDAASGDAGSSGESTTGGCVTPTTWYLDDDGDGFGDPATAVDACEAPSGDHVGVGGDCDDTEELVHPDRDETCDDVDDDCDGGVDEGSPANAACDGCQFFLAADGDHYFALCPGPLTYEEARSACDVYGPQGELAVVDNATDDATLAALVISTDVFLGIDDLETEGTWVWDDGTAAISSGTVQGYDGWADGEPNGGTSENCAEYDPAIAGWNDGVCDLAQPYFCRHPA